eukprot:gene8382-9853_t
MQKEIIAQHDLSPETNILTVATGYFAAQALYSVVHLGVQHEFKNGPRSVVDIAKDLKVSPEFLYRALRALSTNGIFKEDEAQSGVFDHTASSRLLMDPAGMANIVQFFGNPNVYDGWRNFADTVIEGTPQGPRPISSGSAWNIIPKVREIMGLYNKAFNTLADLTNSHVLRDFDFTSYSMSSIIDINGGNGSFMKQLLTKYPHIEKGVCYDSSSKLVKTKIKVERYSDMSGNVFDGLPASQNYLMRAFCQDYDDKHVSKLFGLLKESMIGDGRVFMFESIILSTNKPSLAAFVDLNLMHCVPGGKCRTTRQWAQLIDANGFKIEKTGELSDQLGYLVLSKK